MGSGDLGRSASQSSTRATTVMKRWQSAHPFKVRLDNNRVEKYFQNSAILRMVLVRLAWVPALSVLLPLWVVQIMLPFVWLTDIVDLNDAYAYLVTLLLTVVAHRATLEAKLAHAPGITSPDVEFITTIMVVALQMLALALFNGVSGDVVQDLEDTRVFMLEDGITVAHCVFIGEFAFIIIRVIFHCCAIVFWNGQLEALVHAREEMTELGELMDHRVSTEMSTEELERERIVSFQTYKRLVGVQELIGEVVRKEMLSASKRMHCKGDIEKESSESQANGRCCSTLSDLTAKWSRQCYILHRRTLFSYGAEMFLRGKQPNNLFTMSVPNTLRDYVEEENIGPVDSSNDMMVPKDKFPRRCTIRSEIAAEVSIGEKVVHKMFGTNLKSEVQYLDLKKIHDAGLDWSWWAKTQMDYKVQSRFNVNPDRMQNRWRIIVELLLKSILFELKSLFMVSSEPLLSRVGHLKYIYEDVCLFRAMCKASRRGARRRAFG
jgi:hypothetical protein